MVSDRLKSGIEVRAIAFRNIKRPAHCAQRRRENVSDERARRHDQEEEEGSRDQDDRDDYNCTLAAQWPFGCACHVRKRDRGRLTLS